ncbi:hypothetical protein KO566_03585 [Flavobacteriaceae bacterium XHP0103]|uniref:hypothetical protein n=1 Tax=Marixanthotalea marina TaxID=2844359 RepID=UPI002989B3C5|nr:hypothetical protein [Marixanthotalea marina]MBU3821131.1 hypothetical protein [Marixanthotalea marina]
MYYYLIIALQAYCIYHIFKNRNSYYWIFAILFLPLIGCIIYFITQVYNKRDVEKVQENIVSIINPTKKIKDLEHKLKFSETYQNRVNLADAYLGIKDYNNAIPHYLEALNDSDLSDLYVAKQLMICYFHIEDFDKVILYAEKIKDRQEFQKSKLQFLYGLALEKKGNLDEAETNLKAIDIRYSFYNERLVLAKFLIERGKEEEAKEILEAIYMESQNMTKQNKKIFRNTILEVEKLKNSI